MWKLSPLLGLAGFAIPGVNSRWLRAARETHAMAISSLRDASKLAPVYPVSALTPIEHFPVNSYLTEDPGAALDQWKLTVTGAVARPGEYTLKQIRSLPRIQQITQHVCIEGWAAIGSFAGARLADFLRLVGAEPGARFVEWECADDYYEFVEIPAALHPQTLLCYEMYGEPLRTGHGAPLRLQMPAKLGYKQAKWLTSLRVSHVLGKRRGTWVDQGYPPDGNL